MPLDLNGVSIAIVSRCARTLFTFRLSLAQHLIGRGAIVSTYGASGDGFERRLEEAGLQFHAVPISLRGLDPAGDLKAFWSMWRAFRAHRPTVVHAFTVKPAIYGTLAAWCARIPCRVVTITGLGHAFTTAPWPVRKAVEFLYRFALARAHVVFFQNASDLELFISKKIVSSRVSRLVPGSGVDIRRFGIAELPSSRAAGLRFLMIARLLTEKGVLEYCAAAERLKSYYPQVSFKLLGAADPRNPSSLSPDEVERLRASTALELLDEVIDVRPSLAEADVVVLPSYREGLPRTLLEGASMGRAVVTTDVPGCRDAVLADSSALVVPPKNVDALAAAMRRLIENPQLVSAFGKVGRRFVEETFDEEIVFRKTMDAYDAAMRAN